MKKIFIVMLIGLLIFSVGCSNEKAVESSQQASSEDFPSKDIRIIVPFDPGGGVDVTCRIISSIAPEYIDGRKLIIENISGGGGVVGQTAGAKAKADGYNILAYTSSVISNPMTKETVYTHESFTPVAMYCFDPDVLVVAADSQFKTLQEFIDYAKENEVTVNTPGKGSAHHIAGMILEDKTSLEFAYIHNTGAAMQVQQILGGHVEAGFMTMGEAKTQLEEGSIRALGLMHDERHSTFPDVQTFAEQGVDLKYGAWRGLAVPAETPKAIVEKLGKAFEKILNDPRYKEKMEGAGYPAIFRGPEDFKAYVDAQAENLKIIMPKLKDIKK